MDLVKTHLIYAVRDEIELLKKRIIELELNVNNLELENKILREHIPKEIIENIYSSLDNIPQQQQQQKLIIINKKFYFLLIIII
ncbi:hypothetical protein Mgra_00002287 [Meloidogyne graminicola]|uniref:Uncharacterized protein n=1 Tax=Meloidogyne graminicola TaxID=189291 RepID=A0A8S9ZX48_9BILA|nr:hypothetical protein Mgra_00002287 [Meloidogyne graminicola]